MNYSQTKNLEFIQNDQDITNQFHIFNKILYNKVTSIKQLDLLTINETENHERHILTCEFYSPNLIRDFYIPNTHDDDMYVLKVYIVFKCKDYTIRRSYDELVLSMSKKLKYQKLMDRETLTLLGSRYFTTEFSVLDINFSLKKKSLISNLNLLMLNII